MPETFVIRRGVFSLGGVRSIRAGQVVAPVKRCLEDSLLLSIGRGEISDPALSHFLLHMGQCGQCCVRSDELIRKNPGKMLSTLANLAPRLEKTPPPGAVPSLDMDGIDWIGLARSMRPKLQLPRLECPSRAGELPTFGPYQIEGTLGEGASSVVYKAFDPELGRSVALKVLRPEVAAREGMAETFLAEARALAKVNSPHLVTLLTYGKTPAPHLTMELLEGRSLADRLENGPIHEREALRLLLDLARGLKALHAGGLVHRDIKPANVWLSPSPDRPGQDRAVLMDLGLAGNRSLAAGTPGYQAPELLGQVPPNPASDIFSLGTLLRVMALGADKGEETQGPAPARLDPLIYKMMDPNPERRPTAAEAVALAEAQVGRKSPLKRALVPALLVAGVLLGGGVAWWIRPEKTTTIREVVTVPEEAKPDGQPPNRVAKGVFAGADLTRVRHFSQMEGRYLAVTADQILLAKADGSTFDSFPLPGNPESLVARDGLVAFATQGGEVQVWDLAGPSGCRPAGTIPLDLKEDPVVSLHLAPREEGKLLIHCGKMVYISERVDDKFSGKLRALCKPEQFIAATFGAGLVRLEFAPDSRNILAFTQRGGVICSRLSDMACLWGFRPFQVGPQLFAERPGVPGALTFGSPGGFVGVYGPELDRKENLNAWPTVRGSVQVHGAVTRIDWVDHDTLVALQADPNHPLLVFDANSPDLANQPLGVTGPMGLHTNHAGTLHCLQKNGDVAVWEFGKKAAE